MNEETAKARRYLAACAELREALGIPLDAPLEPQPIGAGEHNANFRFEHPETGQAFVLRVNYASQLNLADQVGYEYAALRTLEASGRTPRALFADNSRRLIDHGALVIEHCDGTPLDYHRPNDLREAAHILADIHSLVPQPDCGLIKPADPLRAQVDRCRRFFDVYRNSPYADSMVTSFVESFFKQAERALAVPLCEEDCTHIVNTEAIAAHFLISPRPQRSVMLDWEKPLIGEVAQDVAYFLAPTTTIWDTDFVFTRQQREKFVHDYWDAVAGRFPKGGFEERYEAYLMTNCLLGTTWSCNAWVEYHDPARPLQNEKTRERLRIYLSEQFLSHLAHEIFSK